MEEFVQSSLCIPPFALVRNLLECATLSQALKNARRLRERRFLLYENHPQSDLHSHVALIQRNAAGDHVEQRGLARSIATDQAHALVAVDRELCPIQERDMAEG